MSTHNICFYGELEKIIPKLSSNNNSSVYLLVHEISHRQESVTQISKVWFVELELNGLVNTIKVMSSPSIYLTTLFLGRLSPLRG